ncbi:MAG: HEPN domain-containing protein [Rhodanobacter sp.]
MLTIDDLKRELELLRNRFMSKWSPADPSHLPEDFEHDVKAYCLLSHAVFEDFAEGISLAALKLAKDSWMAKKFSPGTIPLLATYGFRLEISDDEDIEQNRLFDQIREGLDDSVRQHSHAIVNNHGFSLKYLRAILMPVGIDVPESVKVMESLRELARARGSYAHSQAKQAMYGDSRRAFRPMAPEGAIVAVSDCFELCVKLAERLAAIEHTVNA